MLGGKVGKRWQKVTKRSVSMRKFLRSIVRDIKVSLLEKDEKGGLGEVTD